MKKKCALEFLLKKIDLGIFLYLLINPMFYGYFLSWLWQKLRPCWSSTELGEQAPRDAARGVFVDVFDLTQPGFDPDLLGRCSNKEVYDSKLQV